MSKIKFISVRMQQKDWDRVRKAFETARKLIGGIKRASDNEVACDMIASGTKHLESSVASLKETP